MINELAKRLIFRYFQNHSVTDTLRNTLTSKIRYCRFVAAEMEESTAKSRPSPCEHR